MTKKTDSPAPEPIAPASSGLAIASLILGIVSFTGFGLITGIPAVIFGIIALNKKQGERSMSIAGIIMGAVSTLLSLLLILFAIIFIIMAVPNDAVPYEDSPGVNESWIRSSEV